MWQQNVSWSEGLFSEIPFKRFQQIKTNSPLAIFTRMNSGKGNDWTNLKLEGIQLPSSPAIRAFDTLFSPDYYIVAVDTRLRKTKCLVDIKTRDNIFGKVEVEIEYQVYSLEALLEVDDPLSRLKDSAGELMQEFVSLRSYSSVNEIEVKGSLSGLEVQGEAGISVKRFFNVKIQWPEAITKTYMQNVIDDLQNKNQLGLNALKVKKLNDFGIHDPVLIASVLSVNDTDFSVIMDHVRNASQAYKDQTERDLGLLNWLKDKDLLTRADVQNVIDSLTKRINDQGASAVNVPDNLLSSMSHNQAGLGDGETPNKDKPKSEGPEIVGRRRINVSDKSDES